jgi:hypothetical protein
VTFRGEAESPFLDGEQLHEELDVLRALERMTHAQVEDHCAPHGDLFSRERDVLREQLAAEKSVYERREILRELECVQARMEGRGGLVRLLEEDLEGLAAMVANIEHIIGAQGDSGGGGR